MALDFSQYGKPDTSSDGAPDFSSFGTPDEAPAENPIKTVGTQFIAGLNDVTELLVRPIERTIGTVIIGKDGIEVLSPDEIKQRRESGDVGLPGMATSQPTDIIGKGSRMAGQSAALGPIIGRMFGLVPTIEAGAKGFLGQQTINTMARTFAGSPIASTAMDTLSGFTAGVGGGVAEKLFPGSDAAEFTGQIVGGMVPALTPTSFAVSAANTARNIVNKMRQPFTEVGGRNRAITRIDRAIDASRKDAVVGELDKATTIDPATGKPVLTPAQRTAEPGLLSLEKAVLDSSEELARQGDEQIAHANKVIQESMSGISPADPQAAFKPIVEAHAYLDNLLETRIRVAAQHTDERIAQLGTGATREQANLVAREELEKALDAAVTQQRELYALIPENTAAPFSSTKAAFDRFRSELGSAQMSDIPPVAAKLLSDKSSASFSKNRPVGFKTGETSIKELRSLQSKLRAEARNARAGDKKNLNMARIADGIADAIDDDLMNAAAGTDVHDAISTAVNFSRNMHDRFSRGKAGQILGYTATGADRVPAGMTLEQSIGMSGPKAREALDSLMKVFDSPEAPSADTMKTAVQDYVKTRFLKSAVEKGDLNLNAARRFVSNNDEILKRLPALKKQIDEVIQSGNTLAMTQRQRDRILLDDPRVSKATFLIEKGPVETFRQIGKLSPSEAAKETQMLINRVSRDESGEALSGLKSGFVELLMNTAKSGQRDAKGVPFMSGYALRDALEIPGNRAAANKLFSEDELNRIGIITRDLIKLEKALAAKPAKEGVTGDAPGTILNTLVRIIGAKIGAKTGGTIQSASIMSKRMQDLAAAGVRDPASRLLRDAIQDETLFKELIQSVPTKDEAGLTKEAARRLNAWAAAVIAEQGGAFEDEE